MAMGVALKPCCSMAVSSGASASAVGGGSSSSRAAKTAISSEAQPWITCREPCCCAAASAGGGGGGSVTSARWWATMSCTSRTAPSARASTSSRAMLPRCAPRNWPTRSFTCLQICAATAPSSICSLESACASTTNCEAIRNEQTAARES